jgi:cysteinyl-tRNA synthetase
VWMHNGFLQVEGRKMAKSEGNFVTIHEILNTNNFGGRQWSGAELRLAMLRTQYTQPLDWTVKSLHWASDTLQKWFKFSEERTTKTPDKNENQEFISFLMDDLNTPGAISIIERAVSSHSPTAGQRAFVFSALKLLGFESPPNWTKQATRELMRATELLSQMEISEVKRIESKVRQTPVYKNGKLRPETKLIAAIKYFQLIIASRGFAKIELPDHLASLFLELSSYIDVSRIEKLKEDRLAARSAKDWAEADRMRSEMIAMGVDIFDTKDPETGELVTEWELKR